MSTFLDSLTKDPEIFKVPKILHFLATGETYGESTPETLLDSIMGDSYLQCYYIARLKKGSPV